MTESSPIRRVLYCPHCGNKAPQRLIHRQRYLARSWNIPSGKEDPIPWSTFVAACDTCDQLLLYENLGDQLEDNEFQHGDLSYPRGGVLHASVPDTIRSIFEEAARIREIAPNAFAVQIRRALEALCEDRGAKGRSLGEKLKHLSGKGEIPPVLAEMTDVLRLIGNLGAHGIGQSVHPLQAGAINEFFLAVIEYVYIAPAKLRAFKDRMDSFSNVEKKEEG